MNRETIICDYRRMSTITSSEYCSVSVKDLAGSWEKRSSEEEKIPFSPDASVKSLTGAWERSPSSPKIPVSPTNSRFKKPATGFVNPCEMHLPQGSQSKIKNPLTMSPHGMHSPKGPTDVKKEQLPRLKDLLRAYEKSASPKVKRTVVVPKAASLHVRALPFEGIDTPKAVSPNKGVPPKKVRRSKAKRMNSDGMSSENIMRKLCQKYQSLSDKEGECKDDENSASPLRLRDSNSTVAKVLRNNKTTPSQRKASYKLDIVIPVGNLDNENSNDMVRLKEESKEEFQETEADPETSESDVFEETKEEPQMNHEDSLEEETANVSELSNVVGDIPVIPEESVEPVMGTPKSNPVADQQDETMLTKSHSESVPDLAELSEGSQTSEEATESDVDQRWSTPFVDNDETSLSTSRDESNETLEENSTKAPELTETSEEEEGATEPEVEPPRSTPLFWDELSVMAMSSRRSCDSDLGISFQERKPGDWRIVISHILPDSLFSDTELRAGQTLLAVNGIPANDFGSAHEVMSLLRKSLKFVIVATKSIFVRLNRVSAFGMFLVESSEHELFIRRIYNLGLSQDWSAQVIKAGMRIIAINNETNLNLSTANQLLKEETDVLDIVAIDEESLIKPKSSTSFDVPIMLQKKPALFLEESSAFGEATKPTKETKLGIGFKKRRIDGRIVISVLKPDGMLANTGLKVGQTLLAVNERLVSSFAAAKNVRIYLETCLTAKIVATKSILATVIKEKAEDPTGIELCYGPNKNGVWIHRIEPDSLFGCNGLLEVGMKVVAINARPCPANLVTANALLQTSTGPVTIIGVFEDAAWV